MATQTIDATLFASSHIPIFVKRTSVSGLIFSVAMCWSVFYFCIHF